MNTNLVMLLIAFGFLVAGAAGSITFNYLAQKGKDPKAILDTADTVIGEVKDVNDTLGKLLPAPVESLAELVIKFSQAGVHAAQQLCNSNQLTEDQRKQKAFDAAMNLLKLEGYEPTPELETAVKDMIETGVFALKNIVKAPAADTTSAAPDQAVHQAIAQAVTQVVTPIATQAASDAVQQAISQTAQAFQGAVTPQTPPQATQVTQPDPQLQAATQTQTA